jgi:twitching motility two-component system response regulator PilH
MGPAGSGSAGSGPPTVGKIAAPKIAPPPAKVGAKTGAWKTILVVDPDVENRKRVISLLRDSAEAAGPGRNSPEPAEAGAETPRGDRSLAVHEADNGSAAWALVEVVKPDLVVAEILLEGQSGMQLLRRLRDRYGAQAPAMIFVTSMSNEVDRYWALRNGANAYVIKPFDDEFLRTRAIKYFEDRRDGGLDLDSNWIAET